MALSQYKVDTATQIDLVWCMRSTTAGKVSLQDGFELKGRIYLSLCYSTVT